MTPNVFTRMCGLRDSATYPLGCMLKDRQQLARHNSRVKFYTGVPNIPLEGTVSQISYLGFGFYFMIKNG